MEVLASFFGLKEPSQSVGYCTDPPPPSNTYTSNILQWVQQLYNMSYLIEKVLLPLLVKIYLLIMCLCIFILTLKSVFGVLKEMTGILFDIILNI